MKYKQDRVVYLDGTPYTIVRTEDRNGGQGLPGVTLLGDILTLVDADGNRVRAYPWDIFDPEGHDSIHSIKEK